jgi:hypothetical protein
MEKGTRFFADADLRFTVSSRASSRSERNGAEICANVRIVGKMGWCCLRGLNSGARHLIPSKTRWFSGRWCRLVYCLCLFREAHAEDHWLGGTRVRRLLKSPRLRLSFLGCSLPPAKSGSLLHGDGRLPGASTIERWSIAVLSDGGLASVPRPVGSSTFFLGAMSAT